MVKNRTPRKEIWTRDPSFSTVKSVGKLDPNLVPKVMESKLCTKKFPHIDYCDTTENIIDMPPPKKKLRKSKSAANVPGASVVREETVGPNIVGEEKKLGSSNVDECEEKKVEQSNVEECEEKKYSTSSSSKAETKREPKPETDNLQKRFKNDLNFVLSKHVVKHKVGFNIDDSNNNKVSSTRKKMLKILEQADIMKLKSVLDGSGDKVCMSKYLETREDVKKMTEVRKSSVQATRTASPCRLSNENSPDISIHDDDDVKVKHECDDVDNMPVLEENPLHVIHKPELKNDTKEELPSPPSARKPPTITRKELLKRKFYSSQSSKPASLDFFSHVKKKDFKIPRNNKNMLKAKSKNGQLWQWALTVDENGMYSK